MKTTIVSGLNRGVWGEMSKYKDDNFLGLNGGVWGDMYMSKYEDNNYVRFERGCVGRDVLV